MESKKWPVALTSCERTSWATRMCLSRHPSPVAASELKRSSQRAGRAAITR